MTTLHRTAAVLFLAATLAAPGCKKDSKPDTDKKSPTAAAQKADPARAADKTAEDPYAAAEKEAELDKALDAITNDSATGTVKTPDGKEAKTDAAAPAAKPESAKELASKEQIIRKLLPAMDVDRQLDMLREMFAQDTAQLFLEYLQQSVVKKGLYTEENAKTLDKNLPQYMEKLMAGAGQLIDNKQIRDEILLPAYKEQFSSQELQGMLDFFSSPAGKAYIAKNPLINQGMHQAVIKQKSSKVEAMVNEIANAAMAELTPPAEPPKQ